ncbi:MAG: PAS domain-containing protein [Sneathiellaceae bacterium]
MTVWRRSADIAMGEFGISPFVATPDILDSPALGWLAGLLARKAGRLPARDDISPRRIGPAALPYVLLLRVEGDPARFLVRLVGTELVRISGIDNTGRYFDQLGPQHGAAGPYYLQLLEHVRADRRPVVLTANLFYRQQEWRRFQVLVAPVAGTDDRIDQIACAIDLPPVATAQ